MKSLMVAFLLVSSIAYSQDAREIMNRYLDTVSNGNIENWNKIKSMYTESESYYSQQDFDQKVNFYKTDKPSFHKHYTFPPYGSRNELYSDSTFSELQSTFYFLKDKTIIILGKSPPIINKNARKPSEFSSIHTPVFISNLVNKSSAIEMMGIKEFPLDGTWCYQIKVTTKGRNYYFYINTETYLMDYWTVNQEEDLNSLVKYYNYKRIGDFLMPMSYSAMRNGFVYNWTNHRKIELNPEIDPDIFIYKGERE